MLTSLALSSSKARLVVQGEVANAAVVADLSIIAAGATAVMGTYDTLLHDAPLQHRRNMHP